MQEEGGFMKNAAKAAELLLKAGLPQFELGTDGYPLPGNVIKYYREKMKYTDRDGKEKRWTQADLARQLGLTEIMVNLMEKQNKGLDSIERRRTLATILRIPPALLGPGSLDLIVEVSTGHTATNQTNAKRTKVNKDTIKQYQTTYKVYETLFADGLTYASIGDINKWVKRIEQDIKNANVEDRNAMLRVGWDFELLCAKVYGSDLGNWNKTFEHLDNALEIATTLDDRDLQAASLHLAGVSHARQGRPALAKVDIDGALIYTKGALPQTKGAIYADAAYYHAQDTSLSGITLSQHFLNEAQKYAGVVSEVKTIKFGTGMSLLGRAMTLLRLNRPAKAIEFIANAERHLKKKRLLVFLDILRAKCYIEQKKPEYEEAVKLLESVIIDSNVIKVQRHIKQIEQLYAKLAASSYGNSPDVTTLSSMLEEL